MVTITLYTRQQKRHWCIEQSFGLCGRGRGRGWDDLGEWHWNMYNIIYETSRQFRFDARYWMLGAGALGRPRGIVWGSLFKTEITGLIPRRSNWVETEMECAFSIAAQVIRFWFRWSLETPLGRRSCLYSPVRKDWKFDLSWWTRPDAWASSGGWWVSDTLLLQWPYYRLVAPQWFVSAAAVRWSGCLQSFGIQVCRTDRNGGRPS